MTKETSVREVMSPSPLTISPDEKVQRALEIMERQSIGSVIVVENNKPIGIVTRHDLGRAVRILRKKYQSLLKYVDIASPVDILEMRICQIMSRPLVTVGPDATISKAYDLMVEKNIHHLPVLDKGKLIGIISNRDLFRWILKNKLMLSGKQ